MTSEKNNLDLKALSYDQEWALYVAKDKLDWDETLKKLSKRYFKNRQMRGVISDAIFSNHQR